MSIKQSSDRVKELECENTRLRQELAALGAPEATTATPVAATPTAGPAVEVEEDRVLGNINLAPGFVGYGWKNSLYTSMLRVLSQLATTCVVLTDRATPARADSRISRMRW